MSDLLADIECVCKTRVHMACETAAVLSVTVWVNVSPVKASIECMCAWQVRLCRCLYGGRNSDGLVVDRLWVIVSRVVCLACKSKHRMHVRVAGEAAAGMFF